MTISPISLATWLSRLETLHPTAIELGLDRIRAVAQRLGIDLGKTVVITVGGTNGKGSTCAMLDAILRAAGYRTGLYTSPHLIHFNERIRIDGEMAEDAAIVAAFEHIEAARGDTTLTYFEYTTLAALLLFMQAKLDAIILEVGLGGRLDAVNLIDADCAIVTSVDIDHTDWLGDTREHIGLEKAHIYRKGKPAICADPAPPASLLAHAQNIDADLWLPGRDFDVNADRQQWAYRGRNQRRAGLAYPALRGVNQLSNASAALAALEALRDRLAVPAQAIRTGLARAELPGRLQVVPGVPAVILDVAHNPHAAAALGKNLDDMPATGQTHAVVGMLRDKDVAGVVHELAQRIDHWHCAGLAGARGLSGQDLADAVRGALANVAPAAAVSATPSAVIASVAAAVANATIRTTTAKTTTNTNTNTNTSANTSAAAPAPRPRVVARSAGAPDTHSRKPAKATITPYAGPLDAWAGARKVAGSNDRIVIFGSFHTVAPVLQALQRHF